MLVCLFDNSSPIWPSVDKMTLGWIVAELVKVQKTLSRWCETLVQLLARTICDVYKKIEDLNRKTLDADEWSWPPESETNA